MSDEDKKYAWGHRLGQHCSVCRYSTNQTVKKDGKWYCLREPKQLEIYANYWCGEWQPVFTVNKLEPEPTKS